MQDSMVVQVQRVRRLSDRVREYELASPDRQALPQFGAGAHIELHVPGIGARHYSCVRPWSESGPYVIAVQREAESRGGSHWLHDNLEAGSLLEISTPRNKFPLVKDAQHKILIAGGIGITPLLCMALELDEAGIAFEFIVCARDESQLVYSEDLRALQARGHVSFVLSDGNPETRFDFGSYFAARQGDAQVYCCGPDSLMASVRQAVEGRETLKLVMETFGPGTSVPDTAAQASAAFQVRCVQSDVIVQVPAGKSILDCLTGAGVEVDHSCREGYCGTCITRYSGGSPVHLDTCLGDAERQRYVAVCVSRAQAGTELILDI